MDEDVQQLLQKKRYSRGVGAVVNRYETKVFRTAFAFLQNAARAEEITQEIFLKLWQALPDYDARAAPGTCLYTIARNTCLSASRSDSYRKTLPLDATTEPAAATPSAIPDQALAELIDRLPEIQRTVMTLFYLQEKEH
jgi:RNA polymerase sigma-70 factor (ECF subfamily)